jgi:RimJ/RimL family protein N-acetyltransferase
MVAEGEPTVASGEVHIRPATPADAAALLGLKRLLAEESRFMLLEPGERTTSVEEVASELRTMGAAPNCTVLVAESAGILIGYVEASGGRFRRNRVTAEVVIGVAAAASGQRVGSALMARLVGWAESAGLHRLELTVMAHNHRARRLYHRAGFVEEGRRSQCLQVDGAFVDEIFMARLLPGSCPSPLFPQRRRTVTARNLR